MWISDRNLPYVIALGCMVGTLIGAAAGLLAAVQWDKIRRRREANRIDWQGPDD